MDIQCQNSIERGSVITFESVPGLIHVVTALTPQQQVGVLQLIDLEGWLDQCNQVMKFGEDAMPEWCRDIIPTIPTHLFPSEVRQRRPLFDSVVLNKYQPGEGIKAHVDLLRYKDGICIVALGSSATLEFSHPSHGLAAEVRMAPGDMVLMAGAARYEFLHGIPARAADEWTDGSLRPRTERISITFRALIPD